MKPLQKIIIDWFSTHKRDLPWRKSDAWGVLVSEFMLQQTPVSRVLPKWSEWMERWPNPASLASATPAEIITAWGRLGYPRRALRLYESAKIISRDFNGRVPESLIQLRSLPGVGEYSAAAISAFAFGGAPLVLDINIRRLFARVIDGQAEPTASLTQSERKAREKLIPPVDGALWAAATMEFGALLCTARAPKCEQCPLASQCAWRMAGYPKSPVKKVPQSWKASDRQCRGVILQALRESPLLTQGDLAKKWHEISQVEKALETLLADGLICQLENQSFALPR